MLNPIKIAATLFLWSATTQATPVAQPGVEIRNTTARPSVIFTRGSSNNYCGASTFHDDTSGASPISEDCKIIASNIANGGDWTVDDSQLPSYNPQLVQYGTCAFDVRGNTGKEGSQFKVGNQDIIDIIGEAIKRFGSQGLIGASGDMVCKDWWGGSDHEVHWGLYHT